jgi:hypothetical protein
MYELALSFGNNFFFHFGWLLAPAPIKERITFSPENKGNVMRAVVVTVFFPIIT